MLIPRFMTEVKETTKGCFPSIDNSRPTQASQEESREEGRKREGTMGCSLSGLNAFYDAVSGGGDVWINENRFRIVRQLGEGGFAFVFLVKEVVADGLARKKSINPSHISGLALPRFARLALCLFSTKISTMSWCNWYSDSLYLPSKIVRFGSITICEEQKGYFFYRIY